MDWPSVRQGIKDDLNAVLIHSLANPQQEDRTSQFTGLAAALVPTVINQAVDAYMTPSGFATLLRDRRAKLSGLQQADGPSERKLGINNVRYAFFAGPASFLIVLGDPEERNDARLKVMMQFRNLDWKVTRVYLPIDEMSAPQDLGDDFAPKSDVSKEQLVAKTRALANDLLEIGPLEEMVLGDANAPNTIVEYASMTCSRCARFHKAVFPELKDKYIDTGRARFILREFPLDGLSVAAFMLARCAGSDRFFPTVGNLFENQASWAVPGSDGKKQLLLIAKQEGFSRESFDQCLGDKELFGKIVEVRKRAHDRFGVDSTPTFFIDGRRLHDDPTLKAIETALGETAPSEVPQLEPRNAYADKVKLYDFRAHYFESVLDGRVPGVTFKLKNMSDKALKRVEVTVYFKDSEGNVITEEIYAPVNVGNLFGDKKLLKPGYIWQIERGKFYEAKSVPSEWQEGSAEAEITKVEVAD